MSRTNNNAGRRTQGIGQIRQSWYCFSEVRPPTAFEKLPIVARFSVHILAKSIAKIKKNMAKINKNDATYPKFWGFFYWKSTLLRKMASSYLRQEVVVSLNKSYSPNCVISTKSGESRWDACQHFQLLLFLLLLLFYLLTLPLVLTTLYTVYSIHTLKFAV